MNRFFSTLTLTVGIAFNIALIGITPAQAVTFDFGWNGNGGYSAKGSFSYDEKTAPAIFAEDGLGVTNVLQSLNISFFDPQNNSIATYNNVVDGISAGQYFKFNFNTATQQIFGFIDLGGEVAGETYLSGTVNNNLSLYQVPQSGSDFVVDSSSELSTAKTVPEPNSMLSLVVLSAVGIIFKIK